MTGNYFSAILFVVLSIIILGGCRPSVSQDANAFADFAADPQRLRIEMFSKDDEGNYLRSIENLKNFLSAKKGRELRFAMNGGIYQEDNKPLGLFIRNKEIIAPLNTRNVENGGNFYMQPNGVFYLTVDRRAFIKQTKNFDSNNQPPVEFATQSGPLLVIDGAINPQFKQGSDNLNIRNGVCVREDGTVIFSISRREVNFFDFAEHFRSIGCQNALYLDGFVSRMYLPEKDIKQTDGDFGVIIAITD